MKKLNHIVYFVIGPVLFFSSCQRKVDVEKEKEAIRALINTEKQGYFDKDLGKMASTWVQRPSSVKIFMSQNGETDLFGWAKISESSREEIAKIDSNYRNIRLEFSDFQFNVYESGAWAIFKAKWNWTYKEEQKAMEQTRIMAFEKVEEKWKTTLMAIYSVPVEKEETQKKTEEIPK